MKFQTKEEEKEEEEEEEPIVTTTRNTRSKRMKIDHDEQVAQLFRGQIKAKQFDLSQKKFVFKLASEVKDMEGKSLLQAMWKRVMEMPEEETLRKGTNEALIDSKETLVDIIKQLESENLMMFEESDGTVILI